MKKLHGTGVALVTPFTEKENIDFDGLLRLLQHTSNGCDYYVVQGTTGESATTTSEEKKQILDFVKKNNPKKLPIIYGLGANNTSELLESVKNTDWNGVDAVLSVSPYYNKPSQEGIIRHYIALADQSPVPVILYNVPGRTGSNLTAATTLRLAQHPNIIAIKEASGNMEQAMDIAAGKPKDFLLISGDDLLTIPLLALGAVGVISVLANAFPKIFHDMVQAGLKNDYVEGSKSLFKLLEINPLMYAEGNPVGVKQALKELGVCGNIVRMPLATASEGLMVKIKEAMGRM
jgi:4-hydroxy-tetrahydrodipicolinate synthase